MQCIFTTIFGPKENVDMFNTMLQNIYIYGNLGLNTEIVVYTTTEYAERLVGHPVKVLTTSTYDPVDPKLDIFTLGIGALYEKVLYLDIEIMVRGPVQAIFDVCQDDILYTMDRVPYLYPPYDSEPPYIKWGVMLYNTSSTVQSSFPNNLVCDDTGAGFGSLRRQLPA